MSCALPGDATILLNKQKQTIRQNLFSLMEGELTWLSKVGINC
jgi:hypothetical protein